MIKENSKTLEMGEISFYLRHKVTSPGENEKIEGQEEVQHFYLLLSAKKSDIFRLLIMGKKELPTIEKHEKNLAIVNMVSKNKIDITEMLSKNNYYTATLGKRIEPKALLIANGSYTIIFDGKQTFLNYNLKKINSSDDFIAKFNVINHGNYILSVKNPHINISNEKEKYPDYPEKIKNYFKNLHFIAANPIELINYVNSQLILIGIDSKEHLDN